MKRLSISFSVVLLTFLVLLGSGGYTIGKMICGGNECASTYSLGKAKDCCSSKNTSTETKIKSCCCELIDVSYSLDEFSVSEKVNVSPHVFTAFITTSLFVFLLPSTDLFHPCTDTSPPSPRDYLHFIGILLI